MGKNKNKRRESPIQEDPQEKKVTITNSHIYITCHPHHPPYVLVLVKSTICALCHALNSEFPSEIIKR